MHVSTQAEYKNLRRIAADVEWRLEHRPRTSPRREWWVSGLCFAVVIALHGVAMGPLLLGTPARSRHVPDRQGAGSTAIVSSAEMATTLTLISLTQSSFDQQESSLAELASRGAVDPYLSLLIASPSPDPQYDIEEEAQEDQELVTEQPTGLGEHRAMLFGRYMDQVTARVDRAWLRPRSDIGAARFNCQARIQQDRTGHVLSVELHDCNGDPRWQRSLVTAIERSSPLSAPPEPTVFAPTLLLKFSAEPYVEGESNESEYEPEVRFAEAVNADAAQTVINPSTAIENLKDYAGAIELTIEGKQTTWTFGDKQPGSDSNAE